MDELTTPYTLGSLFDGSGGFPLAGTLCGIEPRWASEVEPYPIAVTRERFPRVKHLGDISKINGAEIEPVDIITFGSPCQDLSVAGKRAGLKHEANGDEETTRSGLFMDAVRIIKEMRRATNGKYPRFALWENVPGAFSSNKGEDFRVVCEELIKVVEPRATMPEVPKNGWAYADSYIGDGWSLAYRTFDAQYWGVPQRRRRIHLIADFRGERAREVLFEREGVRGYFTQGRTPWQTAPADAQGSTGANDREGESRGGRQLDDIKCYDIGEARLRTPNEYTEQSPTITARCDTGGNNTPAVVYKDEQYLFENHSQDTRYKGPLDVAPIVSATFGMGGNNQPFVVEPIICMATQQGGAEIRTDDKAPTLTAAAGMSGNNQPVIALDRSAVAYSINHQGGNVEQVLEGKTGTLTAAMNSSGNNKLSMAYGIDQGATRDVGKVFVEEKSKTLTNGTCPGHHNGVVISQPPRYIVRRLTPTECARLQGFADCWGYIEKKDSFTDEEYKFWCKVILEYAIIQGTAREDGKGWYEIWREVKPDKKKGEDFAPYWENTEKPYQHKTHKAVLTWYNKLWTDSAEYKMWGNGIALPPALYCMQGIVEALNTEEEDDSWMM